MKNMWLLSLLFFAMPVVAYFSIRNDTDKNIKVRFPGLRKIDQHIIKPHNSMGWRDVAGATVIYPDETFTNLPSGAWVAELYNGSYRSIGNEPD